MGLEKVISLVSPFKGKIETGEYQLAQLWELVIFRHLPYGINLSHIHP